MDVDMSLEDLAKRDKKPAAPKRGPRPDGGPARAAPRRSVSGSGQRPPTPYVRPAPDAINSSWKHDMYGAQAKTTVANAAASTAGHQGAPSGPTSRIMIQGLHYEIQPPQLQRIFSQAGTIVEGPTIKYDRSGRSTGIAFVTYANVADAKLARDKLDGQKANGQAITITYASIPVPRSSGPLAKGAPAAPGTGLLGRLGGIIGGAKDESPSRGSRAPAAARPAAARTGSERGARGGAGRGGGRGAAPGRAAKRGPADQDGLDAELEAFMQAPSTKVIAPAASAAPLAAPVEAEAVMEE